MSEDGFDTWSDQVIDGLETMDCGLAIGFIDEEDAKALYDKGFTVQQAVDYFYKWVGDILG